MTKTQTERSNKKPKRKKGKEETERYSRIAVC